ncbi:Short-chain dehydrogenase-like protein [Dinothrombium tinctorium]|uniref:Short-chain dehydrogenase-like protein n=1 Tax=Dinothrombium tinctorium TaxID=1965070 RepID=A0A3S3RJX5_9ACAR|nr:Short-chain dehydrogenase-like protein [Dinothrombium tinctorium]
MRCGVFTSSLLDAHFLKNYEKAMRLDLGVTVKICRLTMPYLIESKGVIVNRSSVYAKKPGVGFLLHSISKAAIDMATKRLALEFGPKGVRVNSVNPGINKTSASQPYLEDENYLKEAKNYSVF